MEHTEFVHIPQDIEVHSRKKDHVDDVMVVEHGHNVLVANAYRLYNLKGVVQKEREGVGLQKTAYIYYLDDFEYCIHALDTAFEWVQIHVKLFDVFL